LGFVWKDIAAVCLLAGALAAWVPKTSGKRSSSFNHPLLAKFWGPIVGPIVAFISFVCSVGNIPLARCYGMATSALVVSLPLSMLT